MKDCSTYPSGRCVVVVVVVDGVVGSVLAAVVVVGSVFASIVTGGNVAIGDHASRLPVSAHSFGGVVVPLTGCFGCGGVCDCGSEVNSPPDVAVLRIKRE